MSDRDAALRYTPEAGTAERYRYALSDIRRCTEYDNAVGQLRKIRRIADDALEPDPAPKATAGRETYEQL